MSTKDETSHDANPASTGFGARKNPLLEGLENILARQLRASSAARAQLRTLQDKTLALELTGIGINVYVICSNDTIALQTRDVDDADVIISGSPLAMLQFARAQDQHSVRGGKVTFTGDVGVAQDFQKLFGVLSPDLDEELSRLVGDETAHRVGTAVRDFFSWGKSTLERAGDQLSEYVTETRQDTPMKSELEDFLENVDHMRADVDRAQARMDRLRRKLKARKGDS